MHIIYRLRGSFLHSVAAEFINELNTEMAQLKQSFAQSDPTHAVVQSAWSEKLAVLRQNYHLKYDHILDNMNEGPAFLADAKAKRCIIESWLHLAKTDRLEIYAISVMSNHVHVLLAYAEPRGFVDIHKLFARHKRFTATVINQLQNKKGRKVWAATVFDRDVRPGGFQNVLWYILNNPVKVGLTDDPINWNGNYVKPDLL